MLFWDTEADVSSTDEDKMSWVSSSPCAKLFPKLPPFFSIRSHNGFAELGKLNPTAGIGVGEINKLRFLQIKNFPAILLTECCQEANRVAVPSDRNVDIFDGRAVWCGEIDFNSQFVFLEIHIRVAFVLNARQGLLDLAR